MSAAPTHAGSTDTAAARCCQEIRATNYYTLLFPSLPRHYIKQTPSLRPPKSCSTPCTLGCEAALWPVQLRLFSDQSWSHLSSSSTDTEVLVLPITQTGHIHPMMSLSLYWLSDETLTGVTPSRTLLLDGSDRQRQCVEEFKRRHRRIFSLFGPVCSLNIKTFI